MAITVTGLSRNREQALQERLMLRLAATYERRYRTEISRAMVALGKVYDNPGKQAEARAEHAQKIERILYGQYNAAFELFGGRILDAAQKSYDKRELKFTNIPSTDIFDEAQRQWIAANGGLKVTRISGTTFDQAMAIINQAVADAVTEGLGQAATAALIAERIRASGGVMSNARARTIARTEAHTAANAANHEAAIASGVVTKQEWVSSADERTRQDHADADGQTVGLRDSFTVGGEQLAYPGDPSGSAENIINCRCVAIHVVE
jgi:hypothetical protein